MKEKIEMKDCRRTLLDEFVKLSKDWDNNNMLYNSLMFSKLYPGDVENSVADASLMPKQSLSLIHISEPTRPY